MNNNVKRNDFNSSDVREVGLVYSVAKDGKARYIPLNEIPIRIGDVSFGDYLQRVEQEKRVLEARVKELENKIVDILSSVEKTIEEVVKSKVV